MALANLRSRLHTRFGADASLVLRAGASGGAEAVLELPYRPATEALAANEVTTGVVPGVAPSCAP
jgi:hypothetical protein